MRAGKFGYLALSSLLLTTACNDANEELEPKQDEIIRATSNGGRNEVVLVYAVVADAGWDSLPPLFGLVLRAAGRGDRRALSAEHLPGPHVQLFVYWGDNYAAEFSELTLVDGFSYKAPAIGAPSHWAQADSFQSHPTYDTATNKADLGVIFLDRKPPFDPLPLFRSKVANGTPVTVTGWGSNSAPTPVTGAGSGVQRTGKTTVLGTPTAADYHADDPNPGMLDPAIRAQQLKTDGHTPKSNGCFGDSGGPIILNQWGQDYIAGVSYWTGLSCEEYNLYSRIDAFLPFFDESYKRGGQDVLKPTFTCVTPNPQGSLTAVFGYQNDNGVGISIPLGTKNALARDTANLRPTRFEPGTVPFGFGVDFTSGQTVSWTLSPDNNPTTTVTATASSPRCTAAQSVESNCVLSCRASAEVGLPEGRRVRQLHRELRRDRPPGRRLRHGLQRRAARVPDLRWRHADGRRQLDLRRSRSDVRPRRRPPVGALRRRAERRHPVPLLRIRLLLARAR